MTDTEKIEILKNIVINLARRIDELAWDANCPPYHTMEKMVVDNIREYF